jgi:putative transposase
MDPYWSRTFVFVSRVPLLACQAVLGCDILTAMVAHRKRIKHYDERGHVRELTFSCYRRLPLLTNDAWRHLLAEHIDRALDRHRYRLVAFVFMPEHVHLIVYPVADAPTISLLLTGIKRPFAVRMKRILLDTGSPLVNKLTVRQRPGVITFRYWQEGPGYDRNLTECKTVLDAIDYVHMNPVRRGLVKRIEDWRWSSARKYVDPQSPVDPLLPVIHGLPAGWLGEA